MTPVHQATVTGGAAFPRPRAALAALAVVSLLAALFAGAPMRTSTYIVPSDATLPAGTRVLDALPLVDALLVAAPVAPARAVGADATIGWRSLVEGAEPGAGVVLDSGVASTRAPEVWETTTRGQGALVALVDTGVADVPALRDAVVAELDFTNSGGGDGYGHGTFMASLIAGRGDVTPGVAPAAELLSLKVARADGSAEIGTVLTALQWLAGPGRDAGVTVATLALGVDAHTPAGYLLDLAVGRLAATGVLVVTASGNESGVLSSPASSPGTFSVGSVDDQGTPGRADDRMAAFSGSGVDRLGVAQPDAVASGVRVVGTMPCGATLAVEHPAAFVAGGRERCTAGASAASFSGSGTSMSTALAAGVAALAWSANQALDAAQLDAALRAGDPAGDPAGLHAFALDAPAAVGAGMGLDQGAAARPGRSPAVGTPPPAPAGRPVVAEPQGANGRSADWRDSDWQGVNWRGVNWRETDWQGVNWRGVNWRDTDWLGVNWRGVNWRGTQWQGVNWRGVNWRDAEWQGVNWRGVNWRGVNWRGVGWLMVTP
ncbi:MAG TPA: S8 family serine peptidase [Egibacteraceae bacterium]|nr:S8 family serine peptidase [Egibacteraceae bacterium]